MEITLESPLDMHLHLRDGDMLKLVAPLSADFAGAVIMPNLVPPVTEPGAMVAYSERIREAMGANCEFDRYMTLFFTALTEQQLVQAKETPGFFGLKLYPAGITTNSEGGVSNLAEAESTLKLMEEMGIPLLVHGESHGFVMDREAEFLSVYRNLARKFPKLRLCMEHITTAAALELLDEFENLCATVTLQHLIITLDDVAGGALKPHLFCKKEACGCAAGVFTAPLALPKLAEIFARHGALDKLQGFVSGNACRIHGLKPHAKQVTLHDAPMSVPSMYADYGQQVVPMYAGEEISWSVKA